MLLRKTLRCSSNWLRKYLAPQSSKAAFTVHRKLSQSLKEGLPAVLREGVYRTRKGQRAVGAVDPASQFARRDCCAPFLMRSDQSDSVFVVFKVSGGSF